MVDINSNETISDIDETGIKEELYILYLEIKGELNNKCIEIDKSQFDENVSNFKIKTLINYLKEIIYILLNNKFKINEKIQLSSESKNINNNVNDSKISELENEIKKYQADIRYLIKNLFQNKIQKDSIEIKLNSYFDIEKDYELLKEKVKYEEGRFLNNDRKDNEILILRTENSNLKKEITKKENNSKNYELIIKNKEQQIKELKQKLSQLNKKIVLLESNNSITNNNFSTIHNNSMINGKTSSRWKKKNDKDERLSSNNSQINSIGNHSLKKKKKIINTKYSKLEMKGIGNLNERTLSRGNSNSIININNSKKKKQSKGISTIDNNSIFNETYNKILNSLINFKINNNNKKTIITTSHKKKSSISMCLDNTGKVDENNKNALNRNLKHKSGSKHKIYHKLMNGIPNSKFPLTSKHNFNKNPIPSLPQKFLIKNNNSFINIKEKAKQSLHFE